MQNPGIPVQQMQRTAHAIRLAGAERTNSLSQHAARTVASSSAKRTSSLASTIPAFANPGIPAQQMQRTGTRERACGSGTGQNPLAEHAQHAPQPRSIAWGGGAEAAMKGDAPCFLRRVGEQEVLSLQQ